MQLRSILIIIFCLFLASSFVNNKPKKYKAKVITALGTYEGEVKLDLHGSNTGMIEITTVDEKNNKEGISVNAKLVKQVIIDTVTYYMSDLDDDNNNIREGYLTRKIAGTDTLGLFMFNTDYYVQLKNERNLRNVNHWLLNRKTIFLTLYDDFAACKSLSAKIRSRQPGYHLSDSTKTTEERLAFWNKVFSEHYNCRE
jgi:hypothetical protein